MPVRGDLGIGCLSSEVGIESVLGEGPEVVALLDHDFLQGIQIGLLNYAGNNPDGLRWLPGINAHF